MIFNCPNCGGQVNCDGRCANCGAQVNNNQAIDNSSNGNNNPYMNNAYPNQNMNYNQGNYQYNNFNYGMGKIVRKGASGLSIVALIFSFIPCLSIIGLILAIIDLIKGKRDSKKHVCSIIAIVISVILLLISINLAGSDSSSSKIGTEAEVVENNTATEINNDNSSEEKDLFNCISDTKNMHVGDIAKTDDYYLSLTYIKRSKSIGTYFDEIEADKDHEIIIGFVEFYNYSDEVNSPSTSSFSCYADDMVVENVVSDFLRNSDGVSERNGTKIDSNTSIQLIINYEVPIDWQKLDIYYGNECVWSFTNEQISSDAYDGVRLLETTTKAPITDNSTVIYSEDYELVYDGYEFYTGTDFDTNKYLVVKYTINNTSSIDIDYSLAGFNMRAYQNNYLIDDASYTINEKVDGYNNIFDVDEIKSGKSAKIYVAYPIDGEEGSFIATYDDGYITSDYRGMVYIK